MGELITYGATILGIVYTIINSFIIWNSVGKELKGFVSAKTKAILILNTIILYFMLVTIIAYYIFEFENNATEFEKIMIAILITIMLVILIVAIPLLIYIHGNGSYEVYYIISNKLYRLKYIENDILFLVSVTSRKNILLKDKNFLFENNHILLTSIEYRVKKKERPDLF
ncbi:hypothetical protein [Listeria marthii]|uniref:hypothetical protein n=1 Tax=Listeria marthii TaxID=529731 RepID=UPI001887C163|nr:hypothetical protein [Listeria marthii]MBF2477535.1 hypothetical protein [Listeria marthii]MBF2494169.1 hypothetical protein [Listeria marthii]MCD2252717.1 hypothetical protein [Listeria marthii]